MSNDNINKIDVLKLSIDKILKGGGNFKDAYETERKLFQNDSNIKGSIEFSDGKAIIKLVKDNYDQSTLTHEFSHYFLKLVELAKDTNEYTKNRDGT